MRRHHVINAVAFCAIAGTVLWFANDAIQETVFVIIHA